MSAVTARAHRLHMFQFSLSLALPRMIDTMNKVAKLRQGLGGPGGWGRALRGISAQAARPGVGDGAFRPGSARPDRHAKGDWMIG